MHFNSSFDNRKVWVCKKCVNKVYVKFKRASNGIDIKLYFCKRMELFWQNINFFDFLFYAKNLSIPYSIKYQKIFLDTINYYNYMLFLNYASEMPSISWNKFFKIRAEFKRGPVCHKKTHTKKRVFQLGGAKKITLYGNWRYNFFLLYIFHINNGLIISKISWPISVWLVLHAQNEPLHLVKRGLD
jgi:hypothetical protein